MSNPPAGDPVRVTALNFLPLEYDLPLGAVQRTAGGFEQSRLPRAVCPQDSDDFSLIDSKTHTANRHHRTVVGLDIPDLQQRISHAAVPR